jgi:cytochrome o ubiquinol oxidase subunit 1
MVVALGGAVLILIGIGLTVLQIVVSIRARHRNLDLTGDPWNGRTLEWSIPSPPPPWNFALLPQVEQPDAFWAAKQPTGGAHGGPPPSKTYEPLHLPRNNPTGIFTAFYATVLGFALIWRIWWLAVVGLLGVIAVMLLQAWRTEGEVEVSAAEVETFERAHTAGRAVA